MAPRRRNADQLRRAHLEFRRPLEALFTEAYRRQMVMLRAATVQELEPFNLEQWQKRIGEAMRPTYRRVMGAGGRRYLQQLAPFVPRKVARWVQKQGPRAAGVLVELETVFAARLAETIATTWEQLSGVVANAEAEGLGNDAIEILLGDSWEDIVGPRTEAITVSEVTGSLNAVSDFLGTELVELNDWISAGDDRVRVTHQTYAAAGPRPPGFNWATLVGATYTLHFPADPACSELAEVVNCRCFLAPSVTSAPSGLRFDEVAEQFFGG